MDEGRLVKMLDSGQRRCASALAMLVLAGLPVDSGAQGSITGTVYDSLRAHAPLANATVVLIERDRYATTDSHGRFRIDSLPLGRYTVGFMHPMLDSLDLASPVVSVEVAAGRPTTIALATPSTATVYSRMCPSAHESETGMVIGQVRDVDERSALANVTVSTDWTEFVLAGGRTKRSHLHETARTNARGTYLLCGVPHGVPLALRAELDGIVAGPEPLTLGEHLFSRVDLAISRRDSASRGVILADSISVALGTHGARGTATLQGIVRGTDGLAMREAVLAVQGTTDSARSDANGRFRLAGVPAGTRTIDVRSIGFEPVSFVIDFRTNGARDTTLTVARRPQELKADTVRGRAKVLSLMETEGFDKRKAQGLGTFITAADLARHTYTDLISVLSGIMGTHTEYGTNGQPMIYLHGNKEGYCIPNIWVDGQPFELPRANPGMGGGGRGGGVTSLVGGARGGGGGGGAALSSPFNDLSLMVQPNMIKGIEVYDTSGLIPAQFDKTSFTGCGSILIWTQ